MAPVTNVNIGNLRLFVFDITWIVEIAMKNIARHTLFYGLVISYSAYSEVGLKVEPSFVTTASEVIIEVEDICDAPNTGLIYGDRRVISVDQGNQRIEVSFIEPGFLWGTPLPCSSSLSVPIGSLSYPSTWSVSIYAGNSLIDPFNPSQKVLTTEIMVHNKTLERHHEAPSQNSVQSGVGLIRGWACDANKVEISIDGGDRIPVAYGTTRGDTKSICNDTNNGYGMVMAWGLLGEGTHRMQTFVDGTQIADVQFEVAGIGKEFAKDLSGVYELQDFPALGESVTVEWSEAAQNFIIVDHSAP